MGKNAVENESPDRKKQLIKITVWRTYTEIDLNECTNVMGDFDSFSSFSVSYTSNLKKFEDWIRIWLGENSSW